MSVYGQSISDETLIMMRWALGEECAVRKIVVDSVEGKDLALLILQAFRDGMTDAIKLAVLVRCVNDDSDATKIQRHADDLDAGQPIL